MFILRSVYEKILFSTPATPIETGGILGLSSNIVTKCFFDTSKNEYGKYTPNTKKINNAISIWQKKDIIFGGFFHSHYPNESQLSQQDIEYIKKIMCAVKESHNYLYFPVVIPQKKIVAYRASIEDGELLIKEDEISLII